MTTGIIDAKIVRVSSQDIMKSKTIEMMMKMIDRMNIDTVDDKPSYMTAVSEPKRLTIS